MSFDAAPLHLHDEVLEAFISSGIWPIVVPARLTWMLQPLDTHGFILYKNWLRRAFVDAIAEGDARPSMRRMLDLVFGVIRHVLQGHRWQQAFDQNGFGEDTSTVSSFIKHQCGIAMVPILPATCPTAIELQRCWPRNRPFNTELVFRCFPHDMLALADAPVPAAAVVAHEVLPLPAPVGVSLLVQALAAGPGAFAPPPVVSDYPASELPSSVAVISDPHSVIGGSLPEPKRRLMKKTTLTHIA
jgi:hypothetical protein